VEDEEEEDDDDVVVVVLSSVSSILELEVRSGCNVCTRMTTKNSMSANRSALQ